MYLRANENEVSNQMIDVGRVQNKPYITNQPS